MAVDASGDLYAADFQNHRVLAFDAPIVAEGVVGNGTPESCTEQALTQELSSSSSVTFNCGPAPMTIALTTYK